MGRSCVNLVGNTTVGQNIGSGKEIYAGKSGTGTLQFKSLSVTGTSMSITCDGDNIYFSAQTGGGGATYWSSGATGLYPTDGENIDLNTGCVYWDSGVYMYGYGADETGEIRMKTNDLSYQWRFNKWCFTRGVSGDFQINVHPYCAGTCSVSYAFVSSPNSGLGRQFDLSVSAPITFLNDDGCRHLYLYNNDMYVESDDVYFKSLPAKSSETNVLYVDSSGKISCGATSGGGTPGGSDTHVQYNDNGTFSGSSNFTFDGSNVNVAGSVCAADFELTSDERCKTNIKEYLPICGDVHYKEFELCNCIGQTRFGVIAQDLQNIYPEVVRTNSEGYLSVSYIDLLIREVAYLKYKVEELENKIG